MLSCQEVQMAVPFDGSVATVKEQMHVDAIVREAEQPEYWFAASRDGNRASHYTGQHYMATKGAIVLLSKHLLSISGTRSVT